MLEKFFQTEHVQMKAALHDEHMQCTTKACKFVIIMWFIDLSIDSPGLFFYDRIVLIDKSNETYLVWGQRHQSRWWNIFTQSCVWSVIGTSTTPIWQHLQEWCLCFISEPCFQPCGSMNFHSISIPTSNTHICVQRLETFIQCKSDKLFKQQ